MTKSQPETNNPIPRTTPEYVELTGYQQSCIGTYVTSDVLLGSTQQASVNFLLPVSKLPNNLSRTDEYTNTDTELHRRLKFVFFCQSFRAREHTPNVRFFLKIFFGWIGFSFSIKQVLLTGNTAWFESSVFRLTLNPKKLHYLDARPLSFRGI